MRGTFMFPVSAAVRDASGVAAGDEVDVEIKLDTAPRELTIPAEFAEALAGHPAAQAAFEKLSPSLSTSGETLTIEESMTLRARTENAGHGDEYECSWSGG
jgi:uncharacterized protein YdeI (YjbR/CyaY-like superfamily)